jgi:threonine/homoserine/homoserine lactone efflux protein
MLTFTAAVVLLLITPGPGVLSTAGVGAAFGRWQGFLYVTGLFLGTNLVGLAVISGLSVALFALPFMRIILMMATAGYLGYLALRIALASSKIAFIDAKDPPGILDGIMLQLINPKAYAVNTTLFSGFAFMPEHFVTEIFLKLIILNGIWIPVHLLWLYFGMRLHTLNLSERMHRVINLTMAVSLAGVVVLSFYSMFGAQAEF